MAKNGDKNILNLNQNDAQPVDAPTESTSIEDIIARGAEQAIASEAEPAPDALLAPEEGAPRKRRPYTRRKKGAVTPEEEQAAAELAVFFSETGIGAVFTNGLNAFYLSCGAKELAPEEQQMLARVFAQWAKYRLPAGASSYQPDLLLVACLAMSTLPRMKPIAETTAPAWRRFFARFKRHKPTPGNV